MQILRSKLEEKKWSFKYELYSRYFETATQFNKIENPHISVVIISWRLHKDTLKNLKSLEKQRKHNFELIFVDNGAKDGEFASLIPYIDTYIKLNTNTGAYLARNVGAVFANGPILLFLEDDGISDIDLIESHIETHNSFDIIAVRGVYLYKTNNPFNKRQLHYYLGGNIFPHYSNLEGNSSYLSQIFYKVGGWDDDIIFGGGGPELAIRLLDVEPEMSKQIYSPASIILHDYVKDEEHYISKRKKQQLSLIRLKEKHIEWDNYFKKWSELRNNPNLVKSKTTLEKYNHLKEKIRSRYLEKIEMINFDKLSIYNEKAFDNIINKAIQYKKCVIFGAGDYGSKVYDVLNKKNIVVHYFTDNDSDKWNQEYRGLKIVKPDILNKDCFIFIASSWFFEIEDQLNDMSFKKNENYVVVSILG